MLARAPIKANPGDAASEHPGWPGSGQAFLKTVKQATERSMPRYRALIHYRGTGYAGWQRQSAHRTIQGELERAIETISGSAVSVVGSGRTDTGVHARGQVAHFNLGQARACGPLRRSLNAVLPADIRVMNLRPAAPTFHARRDAVKKRYEYRIYDGPVLSPFLSEHTLHVRQDLDWHKMAAASRTLMGTHDFSALAAAKSRPASTVRTISRSEIIRKGHLLVYRVEANGFLHHMVRNIVGTLIEVGLGKRPVDGMKEILDGRDRTKAGPTAPAVGLCLVRVWY